MRQFKIQRVFVTLLAFAVISMVSFNACKKDKDDPEPQNPVASFQFEISPDNFLQVTFTNYSTNATSYSWDFGDTQTSTEKDPVHTYATAGSYTVKLTAKNDANKEAVFQATIEITDPNSALALLAGEVSKTWKLFREGSAAGVGPDATQPRLWWALENTGGRPCVYYHEFTFARDGSFTFDDKGMFWGETAVFSGTELNEVCFEAIAANMVNSNGQDVSAWLGGTHAFEYDPTVGEITLTGTGAWLGMPQMGTTGEELVPSASKTCKATITQHDGYDLMHIEYIWDGTYWDFTYASYSNPALEPEVVEEQPPYGEDLPDCTPTEMYNTFETSMSFVMLDTTLANFMTFNMGVADPAGGATNVGEYIRWGTYQELQFYMDCDVQFDNFTKVSLEVYMPSSNDYSGTLTKDVSIVIVDNSENEQWWQHHIQYDATVETMDEWVTLSWNLDSPTSGPGGFIPSEVDDLDFFAITMGGAGHDAPGTFYIRNFIFE